MDTHGSILSWQLMEGEKANQSLRAELRDQEELVHRLMTLETENNALSAEISQVIFFICTVIRKCYFCTDIEVLY